MGVVVIFAAVGVAEAASRVMPVGEAHRFANINAEVDADVYRFYDETYKNVCYYTVTQNGTYGTTECVHVGN